MSNTQHVKRIHSLRWQNIAVLILLGTTLTILYSINLSHDLSHDELYHMLAAEGLAKTGYPHIGNGLYSRNLLITWITSNFTFLPFNPIISARLPSVLFSVITCCILFSWLKFYTNWPIAWVFVILYSTSHFAIDIAQYIRLYSLQAFAFVLGAVLLSTSVQSKSVYACITTSVIGLSCIIFSVFLNYTALMGAAGLFIWVIAYAIIYSPYRLGIVRTTAIIAFIFIFYLLLAMPELPIVYLIRQVWYYYRSAPLFAADNAPKFWIYHQWLILYYPAFWPLTGILATIGVQKYPIPSTLSISIFSTSFFLASFAGPKGFRYIAFAIPFLFMIWAIGLSIIVPQIMRAINRVETMYPQPRFRLLGIKALLAVGVVFFFLGNPAWIRASAMLADRALPGEVPTERWGLAAERLRGLSRNVDVVVATNELGALYYLGRADVTLSRSKLFEVDQSGQEFSVDYRTGLPVISTAKSLGEVIRCNTSGLLVATPGFLQEDRDGGRIRKLIENSLTEVDLDKKIGLAAFYWKESPEQDVICAHSAAKAQENLTGVK